MKNFLIDPLINLKSYSELLVDIKEKKSPIATYGIIDESLGHFLYGLKEHTGKQILLIAKDELKGRRIYEDIKNLGCKNVYSFPKKELFLYDADALSFERSNQRLEVISKLAKGEDLLIITSIDAILDKLISLETFKSYSQEIVLGEEINVDDFIVRISQGGYERVSMVEGVGQFSIRGGIIDFFPPHSSNPIRIELFDEEIDSIRTFDILSQRSIDILNNTTLSPVKEILIINEFREIAKENLENELNKALSKAKNKELERENLENKFNKYKESLEVNLFITNRDLVVPYIPEKYLRSIISYLKEDAIIFLDEPRRVEESIHNLQAEFNIKFTDLYEVGELLPSHSNIRYSYDEIIPHINERIFIRNAALLRGEKDSFLKAIHRFSIKGMQSYHNKMDLLKADINHYKYRGYKTVLLSGTEERGKRLQETLLDLDVEVSLASGKDTEIKSSQVLITEGSLNGGFEYSDLKLIVISDKEIFGAGRKKSRKTRKKEAGKAISLADLKINDYVVHEDHGIGRYEGVDQLTIQGVKKDYLTIRYRGADKLYIPIDQMHLIQKYIGAEGIKPRINKMSSNEWVRTKDRAKKAVEDMALDLLDLYAKRENNKGFAFSSDGPWQRQFEDLFPYEETEGQSRSIEEIKEDLEKSKPMDRLLCGDVGYGKTEVALRAAFKVVMDSKQVAFLVPTTILAQQHYNTIIDRFSNFPINVEVLSRFRTKSQINSAVEKIKRGLVDIVIGTHRLLSKDVVFNDLGLLIIDEEQRFGVRHKETLKEFKEIVDVLTLTATPIPRTLHMSLSGIRDMSVIEEPPEERYPVQTYVVEFNEGMIRDAILKEIARGGQVYYVYNRVESIERFTARLKDLVPEAKFVIGHGQMGERVLEKVMVDFLRGEYHVLVCTTIIETGLDIPNVNTIVIHNADKMGLSQLYQLRGRVGRSNRIAYGYFTYEKNKVLTEIAEKRLRAIKEFTEFGSGFKIAMRDLEIRGAGNLLGTEQHGHIEAIGYDLYIKYLNEAVKRLKGEVVEESIDTTIDIKVDGYIKSRYIEDEEQKIQVYKKIATITSIEDYRELLDELIDRFGDVPKEIENLMDISYTRYLGSMNKIKNINQDKNHIVLEFNSMDSVSPQLIHFLSTEYGMRLEFDLSINPIFKFRVRKDLLEELKLLVEKINSFNQRENNI